MLLQLLVRVPYNFIWIGARLQHEHGMNPLLADYGRFPDTSRAVQHRLDILRKNLEALRRDDQLLFPATDDQMTLRVEFPNIARLEPSLSKCRSGFLGSLEITRSDVAAADQDLAILGYFDVYAREWSPRRPGADMEGMIEANDRRSLREPVALYHYKPKMIPKLLQVGR